MVRTLLLTGATGKLGRVLVRHFLEKGFSVIATGRSEDSLELLEQENARAAGKLSIVKVDLMSDGGVGDLISNLKFLRLRPNYLVNNARSVSFLKVNQDGLTDRSDFLAEFTLDVIVPYELTMRLARSPDTELRAVVNIGSQYGVVAPNQKLYDDPVSQSPIHYGVAKAGLVHLTKELAVRLASIGVRVNCVALGGVEGRVDSEFKKRYANLCPTGRMLREDEVPGPIEMLLSESSSSITGHTLVADGGWSVW